MPMIEELRLYSTETLNRTHDRWRQLYFRFSSEMNYFEKTHFPVFNCLSLCSDLFILVSNVFSFSA